MEGIFVPWEPIWGKISIMNVSVNGGVSRGWLLRHLLLAIVSVGILMLSLPRVALAAQVTHTYSPSSQQIPQGTTFTMTVTTNAGTAHVLEDKLRVLYDAGKLQFLGISYEGSPLNEDAGKIETGTGFIQIYRTNKLSHPGGNFLLASITFKALAASGTVSVGYDAAKSAVINQDDGKNALVGVKGATYTFAPPADPNPPTVTITEPPKDATVTGQLTVIAEAKDNTGVSKVDFAIDGKTLSSDTTEPYSALIDTTSLADGSHQITATATDINNNSVSTVQTIMVNNGGEAAGTAPTKQAKSSVQRTGSSRSPLALLGGIIGAVGLTMFAISVVQMVKRRRNISAITVRRPTGTPLPKGAVPYDPSATYMQHQAPLSPANIPQGTRVIPTDQNDGTHPR